MVQYGRKAAILPIPVPAPAPPRSVAAGLNGSDSCFTLWIIGYTAADVAQIAYFTA
jgi:hypothetical protein